MGHDLYSTSSCASQVTVVCRDRKGLVYDLMRTMKDIEVRSTAGGGLLAFACKVLTSNPNS